MPPIQLSLHHLLNFLKRLRIIGHDFWKHGILPFLQNFVWRCLSHIISPFRNPNQISRSSEDCPSMPCDKANRHSHDNVDCFSRLPMLFFTRWQRSQSLPLPLHHEPDPQMRPSTSQAVVPYSMTPVTRDDMNMSPLSSSSVTTTRAEDHYNRDPPGLSNEMSDFQLIGVTSCEFERYERNVIWYVLTTDRQL